MKGKEENGEEKKLFSIQSIPPLTHDVDINGTGSFVFTVLMFDVVTADKSSRMYSVMYKAVLSAQIQPNAAELYGVLQFPNGH